MLPPFDRRCRANPPGFSLLEMLVAMVVLAIIVVVAASLIGSVQGVWSRSAARTEQFRSARQALETISSRLSQATLNPYRVVQTDASGIPRRYERRSDLRFRSGKTPALVSDAEVGTAVFFQAPTGFATNNTNAILNAALNTWGYFVEYTSDTSYRPPFLDSTGVPVKNRFRLVEFLDPSDTLEIFQHTSGDAGYVGSEWFSTPLASANNRRVLAENIVALVAMPRLSSSEDPTGLNLSPGFEYDSTSSKADPKLNPRHQLPPIVDLAVVAISEQTASRIDWGGSPPDFGASGLFQNPADMDDDLETLRQNIEARGFSAAIFRTSVPIAAARWSTEQED